MKTESSDTEEQGNPPREQGQNRSSNNITSVNADPCSRSGLPVIDPGLHLFRTATEAGMKTESSDTEDQGNPPREQGQNRSSNNFNRVNADPCHAAGYLKSIQICYLQSASGQPLCGHETYSLNINNLSL